MRLAGGTVVTAHDWDVAAAAVLRRGRKLADDAPDEDSLGRTWPDHGRGTRRFRRLVLRNAPLGGRAVPRRPHPAGGSTPDGTSARCSPTLTPRRPRRRRWRTWRTARPRCGSPSAGTAPRQPISAGRWRGSSSKWPRSLSVQSARPPILRRPGHWPDVFGARGVPANPGSSSGRRPDRPGPPRPASAAGNCADIGEIASLASSLGVRAVVADGTAAHESGAGDAAELGYALAVGRRVSARDGSRRGCRSTMH